MKITVWILLSIFLFTSLIFGNDYFIILPQQIEAKQLIFIFVFALQLSLLFYFHYLNQSDNALLSILILYPFINQASYYINFSNTYFFISPAYLILLIHFFLLKNVKSNIYFIYVIVMVLSIGLSVINATNKYLAFTFYFLAGGIFMISILTVSTHVKNNSNPEKFILKLIFSILTGMFIYFVLESILFKFTLIDLINIILRRWNLVDNKYYTLGYKEPNGFSFVLAYLLPVLMYYFNIKNYKSGFLTFSIIFSIIMIFIAGSRGAVISLINTFLLMFFLNSFKLKRYEYFKISISKYLPYLIPLFVVLFYFLISRTFSSEENLTHYKTQSLGYSNMNINLVGTTIDYIKHTIVSFNNFIHLPLGTGPYSYAPVNARYIGGDYSFFSLISNLIVVGAVFGWPCLLIWILFHFKIFKDTKTILENHNLMSISKGLLVIFLSVFLGSLLPGSNFIGPNLNWSTFIYGQPLSTNLEGVPSEYPALISGLLFGVFVGLLSYMKQESKNVHK